RSVFCYTFRSLTAPSLSLVSSPVKSRLSSVLSTKSQTRTAIAYFPEKLLRRTSYASTTSFCRCCCAFFGHLFWLPVMDARAVFAEDEIFTFADDVFMLSCQCDMASAASPVFDRDDHAVFFIAQEPFVNLKHFSICIFSEAIPF